MIRERIEETRRMLQEVIESEADLTAAKVLDISRELDVLIVKVMKEVDGRFMAKYDVGKD